MKRKGNKTPHTLEGYVRERRWMYR